MLLLEDYRDFGDIMVEYLQSHDISVFPLFDGNVVLDTFQQVNIARWPLDLFITDINHPGANGIEVIRKIRSLPDEVTSQGSLRLRHVPIIVASAVANSYREEIEGLDRDIAIIIKPFYLRDLLKEIDRAVRLYRSRILDDLHQVGIGLVWELGQLRLRRCYALDMRSGFECKYLDARGSDGPKSGAEAYSRLILIEDRIWRAESSIQEFSDLMNQSDMREEDFQRFFELHPEFLCDNGCVDYWSQPAVKNEITGSTMIPDFVFKPLALGHLPWSWQVIDLKMPSVPLVVGESFYPVLSQKVHRVASQLRAYGEFFEDERNVEEVQRKFGGVTGKPRLVAVIGRLPQQEKTLAQLSKLKEQVLDVEIRTYDEILEFRRFRLEWQRAALGR